MKYILTILIVFIFVGCGGSSLEQNTDIVLLPGDSKTCSNEVSFEVIPQGTNINPIFTTNATDLTTQIYLPLTSGGQIILKGCVESIN